MEATFEEKKYAITKVYINYNIEDFYLDYLCASGTNISMTLFLKPRFNSKENNATSSFFNKHELSYSKVEIEGDPYDFDNLIIEIEKENTKHLSIKAKGLVYEEYDEDPRVEFSFKVIAEITPFIKPKE